jgi:hypothetical protein
MAAWELRGESRSGRRTLLRILRACNMCAPRRDRREPLGAGRSELRHPIAPNPPRQGVNDVPTHDRTDPRVRGRLDSEAPVASGRGGMQPRDASRRVGQLGAGSRLPSGPHVTDPPAAATRPEPHAHCERALDASPHVDLTRAPIGRTLDLTAAVNRVLCGRDHRGARGSGSSPRVVFRSASNETLLAMVRSGLGSAILPRLAVEADVCLESAASGPRPDTGAVAGDLAVLAVGPRRRQPGRD